MNQESVKQNEHFRSLTSEEPSVLLLEQPPETAENKIKAISRSTKHIMFRLIATAALLSILEVCSANARDFARGITTVENYSVIGFDQESSVEFKYSFQGTLADDKFLKPKILQDDCVTPADSTLEFVQAIEGNELSLHVVIAQESITNSVHYNVIDQTTAIIEFCVRVEYDYVHADGTTESINFHETIVDIGVDLTAGFALTALRPTLRTLPEDGGDEGNSSDFEMQVGVSGTLNTADEDEVKDNRMIIIIIAVVLSLVALGVTVGFYWIFTKERHNQKAEEEEEEANAEMGCVKNKRQKSLSKLDVFFATDEFSEGGSANGSSGHITTS